MKKNLDVPVLKDVVVPGKKDVPVSSVLSEVQVNALRNQIEEIVQKRLQAVLNKATDHAVKDLRVYLNKVLPEFLKDLQNTQPKK